MAPLLGLELRSARRKSLNLTLDERYVMGQQAVCPSWLLPQEPGELVVPAATLQASEA